MNGSRTRKQMIMLVEDDANMVTVLSDRFTMEGFGVLSFYTVEDALRAMRNWSPDLIILDIMMPGMNGITFLQNMRASTKKKIPIVVHSAVADPDEMINFDLVDAAVPKGSDPSALVGVVNQLLGIAHYMEPNATR